MSKSLWLATAATALLSTAAIGQSAQFSPKLLSEHTKILGSDAFEGRGPATRGEAKTVDYIVRQFKAAGVQPGGDLVDGKRQWTQRVPLLKSDIVGDPIVTLQTPAGSTRLVQSEQIALRSLMNGQQQLRLDHVPIVFAGYGVSAPERGWDDFKNVDVRGKVIVVLINDPDFEGGDGDFGGKAMTYYGRWTYKYEEAARRGAAGVLIVHESAPASYGWNTVKNSNSNTMFDIVRDNPAAQHPGLESWITVDTARKLFADAGVNFDQAKAAARLKSFQPIDLKSTLSVTLNSKTETITSYNVAGMVRGKKYPDETVLYTAHWDHLGIGKPDANGDNIYNGAVDNATGIAMLIEQARAFAHGPRPDRSVAFLAVTAEEKGLLGSAYYAANPLYPLSKTVAVLNTDAMNVHGPTKNFSISGSARLDLLDMLTAEAKRAGRYFTPDPHPEAGSFYRSDHFSFAKVGVPAISFDSGNDMVVGGTARGEAVTAEYTAKAYHQPDDEWSASWDFRGMAQDDLLLHRLGSSLANSRAWPNWSQDSEFRATRDQTAGDRTGNQPKAKGGERG
jgi:Zn-dependent M28 family amino/carboxypeptidase